ncbi:HAMP domain-containing histidine kinase [bacterium]|nr:MAG: HAMP domain-containing histidine kinase [bacterium]
MEATQTSLELLSIFDNHIHSVLAIDRDSNRIMYANAKALELFEIPSDQLLNKSVDVFLNNVKFQGSEEVFIFKEHNLIVNRLNCKRFNEQVIFLSEKEPEPGKKAITTAELASSLVAHLFRSPLTALLGLAEMVANSNEQNREKLSQALIDGLQRISGFVDELDTFNADLKADIQRVNIGALIQSLLYELPANKRQLVQLNSSSYQFEIDTDAKLLKEICVELIENAFDFGADTLSPVKIDLINTGIIRISNAGQLPKEIEQGLFIPFFTTKAQNWGLGLSKAVKKAEAIGATLRLMNNSRIEGIIFEIYFNQVD